MATNDNQEDRLARYIEINFERLVVAHLEDAIAQLEKSQVEPLRLFLAARSVHLALLTALSSAMSGTDGIGAMTERARRDWINFFEDNRAGHAESPMTRMLGFKELLERAKSEPVGWLQSPLSISDDVQHGLDRLTALRHWTEHPRPDHHFIEPAWISEAMKVGVNVTQDCFELVWHKIDEEEERRVSGLFAKLKDLLASI